MKMIRCAIYTRKSSDEGLDQTFNSLDAQREACAAYIKSQASEGWTALPDLYDDGGISGGTLERPALKRLLAHVAAGKVDVIVVYKVDRLSRSLFDFAKLVELLEAGSCSFVSITQPISTTTSMGRLTLNMLLSFAQFEREVTAERIRDKIAASKAKGMFMGGVPPIGYRCDGRTLAIVPEHANLVRDIFQRYLRLGNVRMLEEELKRERIHAPRRTLESKREIGDLPFAREQLRKMLKSRLYIGEIAYKEHVYKALHQPIIDRDQWEQVQQTMSSHPQGGERSAYSASRSLLAGKLFDEVGEPLIPVHSSRPSAKGGEGRKRFSYYVSRALHHARSKVGMRIPAREVEGVVIERLASMFDDPLELMPTAKLDVPPDSFDRVSSEAAVAAAQVRRRDQDVVRALIERISVQPRSIEIVCDRKAVEAALGLSPGGQGSPPTLTIPVRLTRSGMAMRLIEAGKQQIARSDPAVIRLIVQARRYWAELRKGELNITELAERDKISPAYVTRVLRLAFLAPDVVEAVLAGRQKVEVSSAMLLRTQALDARWQQQKLALVG